MSDPRDEIIISRDYEEVWIYHVSMKKKKNCININACKNVTVFTKYDRKKLKQFFPHFALIRQKYLVVTILSIFVLPKVLYHMPIYIFTVLQRHHIS